MQQESKPYRPTVKEHRKAMGNVREQIFTRYNPFGVHDLPRKEELVDVIFNVLNGFKIISAKPIGDLEKTLKRQGENCIISFPVGEYMIPFELTRKIEKNAENQYNYYLTLNLKD